MGEWRVSEGEMRRDEMRWIGLWGKKGGGKPNIWIGELSESLRGFPA